MASNRLPNAAFRFCRRHDARFAPKNRLRIVPGFDSRGAKKNDWTGKTSGELPLRSKVQPIQPFEGRSRFGQSLRDWLKPSAETPSVEWRRGHHGRRGRAGEAGRGVGRGQGLRARAGERHLEVVNALDLV